MTGLVFPASAGINRYVGQHRIAAFCVPRVSGDKPIPAGIAQLSIECSPRQRG